MRKNKAVKVASVCAAAVLSLSATACGALDPNAVQFWFYGSDAEVTMYKNLADKFNATYGKEHGITVAPTAKPINAYWTNLRAAQTTKAGPDVFLETDDNFKKNVKSGLTGDLTNEMNAITDIDVSDIWDSTANRYVYNMSTNTSNDGDPIYGYVVDSRPSALYYNETLFKNAGITVISVPEEDLEAFNAGTKADARGKTKAQYGITIDVPARGYFRSEEPYDGKSAWLAPIEDEILIFNNQIAMNWDEVEDLAMIFSKSSNKSYAESIKCEYGYFTEWWFMYGWGVGGDCLTQLNGNGDYNFSLLDGMKNYVVAEGETFTAVSGNVYTAGQSLSIADKAGVASGVQITANDDGSYSTTDGKLAISADVLAAEAEGTLTELPSTKEAFERYLRLSVTQTVNGKAGLNISPKPNQFTNGKGAVNYFLGGELAMLNNYSSFMSEISKGMASKGFEWDIAPNVVYKEYDRNDEVVKEGLTATNSNTFGLVARKASTKKAGAAAFIKWMASKDAQKIKASYGFLPNQESLRGDIQFSSGSAPKNVGLFFDCVKWQSYGDWRYLTDYAWVDVWAVDLNDKVRNDIMTYDNWKSVAIKNTNNKLKDY